MEIFLVVDKEAETRDPWVGDDNEGNQKETDKRGHRGSDGE